jgi:CBS domain-containing protein
LLIEPSTGLVVITDVDSRNVLGVVTLHDLLRAEVEKARSSEE